MELLNASEEFKEKAATIFETAIKSKVRSELEKIQEENDKQMETLAEETMTSVVEKVDDYLNYVVEQSQDSFDFIGIQL